MREGQLRYPTSNLRRINPLLNRACLNCDARMWLADIESDESGQHRLGFDCLACGERDSVLLKVNKPFHAPLTARGSTGRNWLGMARRTQ